MVRCATFYLMWLMTPPKEGTPEQWKKQAYLLLDGAAWTLEAGNAEEARDLLKESWHFAWSAHIPHDDPYWNRVSGLREEISEEE